MSVAEDRGALLAWHSNRHDGVAREIRARKYRRVLTAIAGIFRVTSEPCVFSRYKENVDGGHSDGSSLTSTLPTRHTSALPEWPSDSTTLLANGQVHPSCTSCTTLGSLRVVGQVAIEVGNM